MDIYLAADHRGFELKNQLAAWLKDEGHTVTDVGAREYTDDDDYPDYGLAAAQAVAEAPAERRGIAICGSGVGMAVAANKVPGVRAALMHDPAIAAASRTDDDTNVLALGSDYISLDDAKAVVTAWLATSFSGAERHQRRLQAIARYENERSSS